MDLYEILGISRTATVVEIKRSYRRLARRYHPDVNPGDAGAEARFREITRAQEILCDPDRRRRYDALGIVPESGGQGAYGFEGFDFSQASSSTERTTFGDLFADVLRSAGAPSASAGGERGADLHASVSLTFEEALHGVERQVTVTRREACRSCQGTGMLHASESACVRCQGAGTVRSSHGHMVFSRACPTCGGTGRLQKTPCPACGGLSLENRSEVVVVRVPAGATDGARIRVPGKGNAGPSGAACGDLFVGIQVVAHRLFRRDGDDFHIVVPIAVHEAALGAKIDVPSPDGSMAKLRIPPGTQSGQRFRLRERGAPSPRDGRRGDVVVEVKLVLPRLLDERSKELLREFGRINRENVRSEYTER